MDIVKVSSEYFNEFYYKINHPTGLEIYVYPMENNSTYYAMFGTKYGSIDNRFKKAGDIVEESVPDGIAHYLEHKLFENEDGGAFSLFSKTGASENAFTSFEMTCYLFSCSNNFYESLEILLDFVQTPYFTKENVAKEQGIISQEIKMYDDLANRRVMFNNLKAMYHNHPINKDIAGTVESITEITPELLYKCYNYFYNLNNMVLSVAGNIDVKKVLEICNKHLKPCEKFDIERVFEEEPESIVTDYVEERMQIASPQFQLGFKEKTNAIARTEKDIVAVEILLDILVSESSDLFKRLLDEELINAVSFSYQYFEGSGYGAILFNGESKNPKKVADMITDEINRMKKTGISEEDFERSRKSVYGSNIYALNSPSSTASALMNLAMKDQELFTYIDTFRNIKISDIEKKLNEVFDNKQRSLSVILPL